jgi:hypothetical protein
VANSISRRLALIRDGGEVASFLIGSIFWEYITHPEEFVAEFWE